MQAQPRAEQSVAAASGAAPRDVVSQEWVDGLQATGARYQECVARLHALLLRVARHEVSRRSGSLGLSGPELDDVAQQAADDALMAVKAKVGDFRGESRFTTWAYRFVVLEVSSKLGRHFWRNRPADLDQDGWERLPDERSPVPHDVVEHGELWGALGAAIRDDLTDLQRRVFVAIVLNGVPMDAFARELGSNRNAVYKVLFDARRRLRSSLAAAGYVAPARSEERA